MLIYMLRCMLLLVCVGSRRPLQMYVLHPHSVWRFNFVSSCTFLWLGVGGYVVQQLKVCRLPGKTGGWSASVQSGGANSYSWEHTIASIQCKF